ncbi:MAG: orotate phosphoribosyltransferase [Bacteroidales bacterium]|nr:orotate phosphoribosyltransferase [Bacteroidales bacterium]
MQSKNRCAQYLLQINAIKLNPSNPFTWASGLKSPIYCDNRKSLSYPEVRDFIRDEFVKIVKTHYGNPDVIAGVATGAIAMGVLVAHALNKRFVYVRSEAKKHGMINLIEGDIKEGQSVVVIEDLISTGGSSLKAVQALREANCKVLGMAAIFTYELPKALDAFAQEVVDLQTITDYSHLLETALEINYINAKEFETLKVWKKSPADWSAKFEEK